MKSTHCIVLCIVCCVDPTVCCSDGYSVCVCVLCVVCVCVCVVCVCVLCCVQCSLQRPEYQHFREKFGTARTIDAFEALSAELKALVMVSKCFHASPGFEIKV